MPDSPPQTQPIDVPRMFTWTKLFRTFRIAAGFQKIALAAIGLTVAAAGNWALSEALPFAERSRGGIWPWEQVHPSLGYELTYGRGTHLAETEGLLIDPGETTQRIAFNGGVVLWPVRTLMEPAQELFQAGMSAGGSGSLMLSPETAGGLVDERGPWSRLAWSLTRLFWTLGVWSLFGGAIVRMAAVEFAQDERVGALTALRFSLRKFWSLFTAPLLPASVVLFFTALCFLGGLLGRIPGAGEIVLGVLYFVALIFGLLMALILMGLAAGWPLMYAAIGAEDSDAFDAMSRAYAYVFDRPWHYAWLVLLSLLYGSIVIFFVAVVAGLTVDMAGWTVGLGVGENAGSIATALGGESADDALLGELTQYWMNGVHLLLLGFVHSYFWSVSTVIYFLMRHRDDATSLTEVHNPKPDETSDELRLTGVATSEQPVIERPATADEAGGKENSSDAE